MKGSAVAVLSMMILSAPLGAAPVDDEIRKLVAQLDDERFQLREAASRRLVEIGKPALAAVDEVARAGNAEVRARASEIAMEIRQPPVTVGELEFRFRVDETIASPVGGAETGTEFVVRITNRGKTPQRLWFLGSATFVFTTPDGAPAGKRESWLTDASRQLGEADHPVIEPGRTVVWKRSVRLTDAGKAIRLASPDGTGHGWLRVLPGPGKYRVTFEYEVAEKRWDNGWKGKVKAGPRDFEIR